MPQNLIPMFDYGSIVFKNPLFLEFKSTGSHGWKKDLSLMFSGKTGKSLNSAIKKAGFDGVVTIEFYKGKYYFNESVNISGEKQILQNKTHKPKL